MNKKYKKNKTKLNKYSNNPKNDRYLDVLNENNHKFGIIICSVT